MLRTIFVFVLAALGIRAAIQSVFGGMLLYLWIAYFRPEDWVWSAAFLKSLKLSFLSGVYLLVRAPTSDARFRLDLRVALIFTFLLLSLISTALSPYSAYAWPYWIEFSKTIIISYILSSLVIDAQRFRMAIMVMAFSMGFEGAKQGWVQMIVNPGGVNINEFPLLGDNNGVAVGMLMLVPLFIALSQTTNRRWEQWLHRFFALGVLYRAISTYSRGGFLSAAAMAFVYIARSKRKTGPIISAIVAGAVIFAVLPQAFWDRMATVKVSEDQLTEDSSRSRLHFWRVATIMANDNPLFGVGHNAYNRAFNKYDFLNGRFGRSRSVHSSWFGILAELGYPALFVYVLTIVLALIGAGTAVKRGKSGRAPPEVYFYGVALQCSLVAFIVGGSFVPHQYLEMLWHFIALSMALRWVSLQEWAPESVPAPVAPAPAPKPFQPPALRRT